MDDTGSRPDSYAPVRARQGAQSPLLLIVPLLSVMLGILCARHWNPYPAGQRPDPPTSGVATGVRGWTGTAVLAGGGTLVARLVPLHSDPARQEFDAAALERRLGLGDGSPWRLVLALRPDPAAAGEVQDALPLTRVHIADDKGEALRSLAAPAPPPTGVVDPVAVVMAPPVGALEPGEEVSLVLWGRPPGSTARASGLPAGVELVLHRDTQKRDALDGALARLDQDAAPDGSTER
jgi:hypothetical protein